MKTSNPLYPNITPDLKAWIISQAVTFPPEILWKTMTDAGWHRETSAVALEVVLNIKILPDELPPGTPKPRPQVNMEGMPLYLDAGDKKVSVLTVLNKPHIAIFADILSSEECDLLVESAKPKLSRSQTVDTKTGGEEINDVRTSNGMFFQIGQNEIVQKLESRIARLVNWPIEKGEGLQILQYLPGAEYRPHYDFFDTKAESTQTILKRGGQRVGTFIVYLHEPEQGGGTIFPDINLEVIPKKGNAVFFSYEEPTPESKTLHGGSPVIKGEKWIATKWLREYYFK